jgi:hypothetical protein
VLERDVLPVEEAAFRQRENADGRPLQVFDLANFFCVMMKWLSLPELAASRRKGPPRSTFA